MPSGAPWFVRWAIVRLVVKPRAPAAMPSRTIAAIATSSSAVGDSCGSAPRSPITYARNGACGTCVPTSSTSGRRSRASRYCGKVSQSHASPSANAVPGMSSTPSSMPISQSCCSAVGRAGAKPTPQLPITSDVTPCTLDGASTGSHVACPSKWVWMSTNPGVTRSPSASTTSAAVASRPAPTSATRPSTMRTSATVAGLPVPSATRPLRMTSDVVDGGMTAVSQVAPHDHHVAGHCPSRVCALVGGRATAGAQTRCSA